MRIHLSFNSRPKEIKKTQKHYILYDHTPTRPPYSKNPCPTCICHKNYNYMEVDNYMLSVSIHCQQKQRGFVNI